MNSKRNILMAGLHDNRWKRAVLLPCLTLLFLVFTMAATNSPSVKLEREPETPREFFNAGTRMMKAGKLREAETYLQTALARQDERLRTAALYNLGHARFAQGVEDLKKAPDGNKTATQAQGALMQGARAIGDVDAALVSRDVQRMVEAYMAGRGTRRELKSATKAVVQAIEAFAGVLLKWQRAADDFKGAAELNPSDTNAQHNVEVVNREIAKLVDQLRQLQQMLGMLGKTSKELGEKLKALRGQIPDSAMPPGAPGDDEEDEDMPEGPQPGMQEGADKSGDEMKLSPEEAERILDGFRLDGERRLPMGEGTEAPPKDRNRPNW